MLQEKQVSQAAREQVSRFEEDISQLTEQSSVQSLQKARLEEQVKHLNQEKTELLEIKEKYAQAEQQISELTSQLQSEHARQEELNKAQTEKIQLLENTEKRLNEQFENLANNIFQAKSETFSQQNRQGINDLLSPLKQQIEGFKKQISDQYVREGQERASLKTEILSLQKLNQKITEEASALTKALKGDNKQQGNWGEMVLEKILEESGLREGHEYVTQESLKNEQGKPYQPDVVVHLPQEKDIVIDSKVSLSAYERYYSEQDDSLKTAHLKEHVNSIKGHVRELGKKNYHDLQGIKTLDYVLMFIPIESAFLLAIEEAPELVKLAMDNNILIVSPTNLLVALRTINNIWQYEYQNQNAQEIAKKAGDLYDKFHGFITDMEKLGENLGTVQKRYQEATAKLYQGRGNLVKRIEDFRKLGVQSNKKLDAKVLAKADMNEDE
ncbi:MAG: DNA recombination protein RmuC [Alteromonadaceae bacterium]|nr:DNA recombination protein RmuC [Alteromonadaceae bacterium]